MTQKDKQGRNLTYARANQMQQNRVHRALKKAIALENADSIVKSQSPTDIYLTEKFMKETETEKEIQIRLALENRNKIRTQLKKDGVVTLRVLYEGGGDEGMIGDVHIMTKGIKRYLHMLPVSEDMYTMFYSILEDNIGGWEINDGGRGTIFWNIKQDKIKICHYEHYTGSNYSEMEGL